MTRAVVAPVAAALLFGAIGCSDGGEATPRDTAASSSTEIVRPESSTTSEAPSTTVAPEDVPDPAPAPAADLGQDPELDRLAEECAAGRFAACDTLFFNSAQESEYEAYGDSCGGRNVPPSEELCTTLYGRGEADP